MITNLQTLLKKGTWECVYKVKDTNCMLHSFLCNFLNIFQASFPVKYRSTNNIKTDWITQGIKISCKQKRSLYTFTKKNNDPKYKAHYITYCRILKKVMKEAKKQHYNRLIAKCNNKIKTIWNIIKKETGKVHSMEQVPFLLMNNEELTDPKNMANTFNTFFLTITEKLNIQQVEKEDAVSFLED
jgi:hypothetical protein